jgi:hypothetical protein
VREPVAPLLFHVVIIISARPHASRTDGSDGSGHRRFSSRKLYTYGSIHRIYRTPHPNYLDVQLFSIYLLLSAQSIGRVIYVHTLKHIHTCHRSWVKQTTNLLW